MSRKTLENLVEVSKDNPDLLTIETTVASGLERIAEEECYETFGKTTSVVSERGRLYFNIIRDQIHKVFLMRSIDNVYIIVYLKKCKFVSRKKEDELILLNCYPEIDWKKAITLWQEVYQYKGTIYPTKAEYERSKKMYIALNHSNLKKCKLAKEKNDLSGDIDNKNEENATGVANVDAQDELPQGHISKDHAIVGELQNDEEKKIFTVDDAVPSVDKVAVPTFRVSAKRVGTHSFTSEDIAKAYGNLVQENFLWIVDLTDFDVEIMATITESDFIVSVSLTKCSLHRRNLTAFGLTSLRATISYSLVKLASPQVGDIVIDPLAGSGAIPIEGAAAFPLSYFLAGDLQDAACGLCKTNLDNFNKKKKLALDISKWDSVKLPIRDSSVDIIVTDMPFGKRSGSKFANRVLYPGVLREFGRVLRKGTGRAVLLTADRRNLELAHFMTRRLWNLADRRYVNVGGIKAIVFLLRRTILD